MTYAHLMELALAHYNEGGDSTYECLDEKIFNESDYYSKMTDKEAIEMFHRDLEIYNEYQEEDRYTYADLGYNWW